MELIKEYKKEKKYLNIYGLEYLEYLWITTVI